MLTLRLARGGRPLTLLRHLLLASATAVVSFLLLTALSHALAHPERSAESVARLLWCLVPLAAAAQFAAAAARLDPGPRSRAGLAAAGMWPPRLPLLAAMSTAVCGIAGSAAALLVYLQLRGELAGESFAGAAVELLAAGKTLPKAAVLTLLCVMPLVAAGAAGLAARRRVPAAAAVGAGIVGGAVSGAVSGAVRAAAPAVSAASATAPASLAAAASVTSAGPAASAGPVTSTGSAGSPSAAEEPVREGMSAGTTPDSLTADADVGEPTPVSGGTTSAAPARRSAGTGAPSVTGGLPWGAALIATGLAVETYVGSSPHPRSPGALLSDGAPGLIAGWLLLAYGLLLAGPGLALMCGRLLSAGRPRAVRLLAGRMLAQDALCLGRPLGVLCAVAAAGLTAVELFGSTPHERALVLGPLPVLGAALVVCCVTASALAAAAESRALRAPATATLRRLGTSPRLLWGTVVLRASGLLVVLGPLAWAVGELCAFTLTR